MTPCIPSKPTGECALCMRYAPHFGRTAVEFLHWFARIDASKLPRRGCCPMLVQRPLP